MNYKELFSSINCQRIVFFEDDISQKKYEKEIAIYDMIRMNVREREMLLAETKNVPEDQLTKIYSFLEAFDKCFDAIESWEEEVPYGKAKVALDIIQKKDSTHGKTIIQLYEEMDEDSIEKIYTQGKKYGIGIPARTMYGELFSEYIRSNSRFESIRIYTDYTSEIQKAFLEDVGIATEEQSVVCIIDNQLGENKRAEEIINTIREMNIPERKNIVGCVFSSRDLFEEISKDVYFEFVPKGEVNSLNTSIARSAYNYFIYKLKRSTIDNLETAFNMALENKGIAYFLSRKAWTEGESEYQIIKDWVKLLSTDPCSNVNTIKHLISLSRVINSLEDSKDISENLKKYNTFEAFDYSVNDFFLPVAAGDVFTDDDGHWYVLIGQDCDLARRPKTSPKNALAELLEATPRIQSEFKKWAYDLEKVSIYNFKESIQAESKILQVKYRSREYIANEIIGLCAFNRDGKCRIKFDGGLPDDVLKLIPQYMIDYYNNTQAYYTAIRTIKEKAQEAFDCINKTDFAQRLIPIDGYEIRENEVTFRLRRVCRLTHTYVHYLYKLYLEYRGRQPFQSINLVRRTDVMLPVKYAGEVKDFQAHVVRVSDPDNNNEKRWAWTIELDEINNILKRLGKEIILTASDNIKDTPEEKEYNLSRGGNIRIKQEKNCLCFIINEHTR